MSDKPFLTDIKTLRERARKHMEKGAVTEGYRADRETVIKVLNEALATEIVCVLRYRRHYFMASGINAEAVAGEFLQHSNDEQGHADQIAQRIVQLGGEPDLNPEGLLTRSHAEYVEGITLTDMIREDLVAERNLDVAAVLDSSERRFATSALSSDRSRPTSSSWRFSRSTVTFTATTPASSAPKRTIQSTPPPRRRGRAAVRERARAGAALAVSATVDTRSAPQTERSWGGSTQGAAMEVQVDRVPH